MKYTNKNNFPEYVTKWLAKDSYDYEENVISATTIINPVRVWYLSKKFKDEIEVDYDELIASRYGTALHDSVENTEIEGAIQEQRLYTDIDEMKISGKFDMLLEIEKDVYKLIDIKSTSVWGYIFDKKNEDYIKQLSIYRYLGEKNGYNIIDEADIWMMFTDWSKSRAKQSPTYPNTRVKIKNIKLWDIETTEKFLKERIKQFKEATDDNIPDCDDEELWKKDDVFAVMKKGRISAVSLETTEELALSKMEWYKDNKKNGIYYIDKRLGKVGRCEYCQCSEFCDQYKKLKEQGLIK